jgi:hypothetical protein
MRAGHVTGHSHRSPWGAGGNGSGSRPLDARRLVVNDRYGQRFSLPSESWQTRRTLGIVGASTPFRPTEKNS